MAANYDSRSSSPVSARLAGPKSFPKTLVVEDNPNDALALQCALKQANLGANVHFVSDGAEAMEYLRGKELSQNVASPSLPALLLVALELPRPDGLGLLQWLKERSHLRPARLAILNASTRPEDEQRALALGADFYLTKPVLPTDFGATLATLQRLLLAGPTRPGVRAGPDQPKAARAAA